MAKRKKPGKQLVAAARGVRKLAPRPLLDDVRELIRTARTATAQAVNAALVLLYWRIGRRIRTEVLKERRAEYGDQIISTLSKELAAEFGTGFSIPNLSRMTRFAEAFPEQEIVSTLSRQLGWSHFVEIIPLKNDLQRDFYAEMCRLERWSVRTLRAKVQSMLFERTALSQKPDELARRELQALREEDRLTPDLVFRDPYFLDLLFFHRGLKRLLAIDLKIGVFEAADKGQMELYLRWLERHEMQPGEEPPLGLILCAGKGEEKIELLRLGKSGIRVASYLTELPPRRLLEKKLHDALVLARARLERP